MFYKKDEIDYKLTEYFRSIDSYKNNFQAKIDQKESLIEELEKNEVIDKNLLRYMTIKVKKFDLEAKYFSKKDEQEKKEYKRDYNKD